MSRASRRAALVLSVALLGAGGARPGRADDKASLPGIEAEFKAAIKKVTPATVVCKAKGAHPSQDGSSGVLVSRRGLVLSDGDASIVLREVVQGTARNVERSWVDDVVVRVPDLSNGTFKAYPAKVIRRLADADTSLLRILEPPSGGFPAWLTMGSSDDLEVGDFTFAMGNSFGLSSEALSSLTAGVVSGLAPFPEGHAEGRWEWLYTSAAVNPGVNGGPLVDVEGRLVGTISTFVEPSEDAVYQWLGKVVPVQRLRKLYADLSEAAELFPEARPQKARSTQSAALETTFHAAAQTAYGAVASLTIERSAKLEVQAVSAEGKLERVVRFTGPVSAVVVGARGELVTSLYNLATTVTLSHPPGPGETTPPALTLEAGLALITKISASFRDGRTFPARLLGVDPRLGLALLQAELPADGYALPVLTPAAPEAFREGRFALALGNPYGAKPLASPLLTVGILSKSHALSAAAAYRGEWQTDAGVTDANCGGALVGLRGELFGVLQLWEPLMHGRDSGIGFVVPWAAIAGALPDLRAGKVWKRGLLGVQSNPASTPPVIDVVSPGSPADRAGLKAKDRVLAIDGRTLRDGADAITTLRYRWAGEHVLLTVEREGEKKPLQIDVVLGERPDPPPAPPGDKPVDKPGDKPGDKPEEKPPAPPDAEKPPEPAPPSDPGPPVPEKPPGEPQAPPK